MVNSESGCALTSSTRFGLISHVVCGCMHMDVQNVSFDHPYVACARMNVRHVLFDCAHFSICGVHTHAHRCPTCGSIVHTLSLWLSNGRSFPVYFH